MLRRAKNKIRDLLFFKGIYEAKSTIPATAIPGKVFWDRATPSEDTGRELCDKELPVISATGSSSFSTPVPLTTGGIS